MQVELHVFDFDGTLFNSPLDSLENHKLYEKAHGMPWIIDQGKSKELTKKFKRPIGVRRGWWGRPETLEPPLVPEPAPQTFFNQSVVEDFHKSKENPESVTVVMTGRFTGLKNHVLRICRDGNLFSINKNKNLYENIDEKVQCFFLGDSGPDPQGSKPSETLPWKIWIIEQLLRVNPTINKIVIWEDRIKHVEHFRELNGILANEIVVNHIDSGE